MYDRIIKRQKLHRKFVIKMLASKAL